MHTCHNGRRSSALTCWEHPNAAAVLAATQQCSAAVALCRSKMLASGWRAPGEVTRRSLEAASRAVVSPSTAAARVLERPVKKAPLELENGLGAHVKHAWTAVSTAVL